MGFGLALDNQYHEKIVERLIGRLRKVCFTRVHDSRALVHIKLSDDEGNGASLSRLPEGAKADVT